jgi:histidine triad (HIT) family protein
MSEQDMSPEEVAKAQAEQCIFCKIIAGQIPSKKVYEDDKVFAVLDINPASEGHVILLPKNHYQIMPQIPDEELANLFLVSKKLSKTLLQTYQTGGTTIFVANGGVAGQRAPHFMIHIVPRRKNDGLFKIEKNEADQTKLVQIQQTLIASLSKMFGKPVVEANSPKTANVVIRQDQPIQIQQIPPPNKGNQSGNETIVQQTQPGQTQQIPPPNQGNKSGDTNIVQQTQPNQTQQIPTPNNDNQFGNTQQDNNLQEQTNDKPKSKSSIDLDKIGGMFLK